MLFRPLEEAFDNGYLVFLENDGDFIAHWLGEDDTQVAEPRQHPWKNLPLPIEITWKASPQPLRPGAPPWGMTREPGPFSLSPATSAPPQEMGATVSP